MRTVACLRTDRCLSRPVDYTLFPQAARVPGIGQVGLWLAKEVL